MLPFRWFLQLEPLDGCRGHARLLRAPAHKNQEIQK